MQLVDLNRLIFKLLYDTFFNIDSRLFLAYGHTLVQIKLNFGKLKNLTLIYPPATTGKIKA